MDFKERHPEAMVRKFYDTPAKPPPSEANDNATVEGAEQSMNVMSKVGRKHYETTTKCGAIPLPRWAASAVKPRHSPNLWING